MTKRVEPDVVGGVLDPGEIRQIDVARLGRRARDNAVRRFLASQNELAEFGNHTGGWAPGCEPTTTER